MPTVSACLIVRDEEEILGACLESLRGAVDEICVIDTGSKDRSIEIARAHGAKIGHFAWIDDFAAARNASLELATSDWIFQVDADELLDPSAHFYLRRILTESNPICLVEVELLRDQGPSGSVLLPRLFRRDGRVRYRRAVHESVLDAAQAIGWPDPVPSGVRLIHYGYLQKFVQERNKHERNLNILRAARDRGQADAYDLYKLASTSLQSDGATESLWAEAWTFGLRSDSEERSHWPWWPRVAVGWAESLALQGLLGKSLTLLREMFLERPDDAEVGRALRDHLVRGGWFEEALDLVLPQHASHLAAQPGGSAERDVWVQARAAFECGRTWQFGGSLNFDFGALAKAEKAFREGQAVEGWEILESLVHRSMPEAKIFAARMALETGDLETAQWLLGPVANLRSWTGRQAQGWLWATSRLANREPKHFPLALDIDLAVFAEEQARGRDTAWIPDAGFNPEVLQQRQAAWKQWLAETGILSI